MLRQTFGPMLRRDEPASRNGSTASTLARPDSIVEPAHGVPHSRSAALRRDIGRSTRARTQERSDYTARRSRGSSTSRMPSPSRLKASTVERDRQHPGTAPATTAAPGRRSASRPACCPRSASAAGCRRRESPSAASMTIATPRCVVARIRYGATHCGRMCRDHHAHDARRRARAPPRRTASPSATARPSGSPGRRTGCG